MARGQLKIGNVTADVNEAVEKIVAHIEGKREALGINRATERKLLDMKDRRELKV